MNFTGVLIGLVSFLSIGVFHPIVIKAEYHFFQILLAGIPACGNFADGGFCHCGAGDTQLCTGCNRYELLVEYF